MTGKIVNSKPYVSETVEIQNADLAEKLKGFFTTAEAKEADLITLSGPGIGTAHIRGVGTSTITATTRARGIPAADG